MFEIYIHMYCKILWFLYKHTKYSFWFNFCIYDGLDTVYSSVEFFFMFLKYIRTVLYSTTRNSNKNLHLVSVLYLLFCIQLSYPIPRYVEYMNEFSSILNKMILLCLYRHFIFENCVFKKNLYC